MSKKKRGAPRGNHNALKHGFYSAAFKDHERRILSQPSSADLSAEVELLRVANYRFIEALRACPGSLDGKTQVAALRALNLSVLSIKRLLNARILPALVSSDDPLSSGGFEALPEPTLDDSDAPHLTPVLKSEV